LTTGIPPPSPKRGISGQAQKSCGACGTLLCGADAIQCKRLVPFYNFGTNGGGLEKRSPDPFAQKPFWRRKIKKNLNFKSNYRLREIKSFSIIKTLF
jgi:hypothetical protein